MAHITNEDIDQHSMSHKNLCPVAILVGDLKFSDARSPLSSILLSAGDSSP